MMRPALRTVATGMASAWDKVPEAKRRLFRPLARRVLGPTRLLVRERDLPSADVPSASPPEPAPRWVGSPRPVLLIAGHSHRHAFADYFKQSGETAPIALLDYPLSTPIEANPYWDLALATARERNLPLATVWGGNQHNVYFLLEADEGFSIFPASGPWEDERPRPLLPRSLIREFFALSIDPLRAILKNAEGVKLLLLGTPPPKSDDQIRAAFENDPWLAEWAVRLGMTESTLRITPLAVRVELWKITQELLRDLSDEWGMTFVGVPDRAWSSGALPAQASAPDCTHANGYWADVMIQEANDALATP